ncbi:MAG: glycosyltransferase family 4 protein [Bacteroidota bacterium]
MKLWLLTVGEPLPTYSKSRLHKTGILAHYLSTQGHDIVWWTSKYDHLSKSFIEENNDRVLINNNLTMIFLHGMGYKKNISIRRLINHWQIGKAFINQAVKEPLPDLILCSFPTIELSLEAVRFGKKNNIPVIIDVRDLWPDIFIDVLPHRFKWLGKVLLFKLFRDTATIFRQCSAIIAVSPGYLNWALSYSGRIKNVSDKVFSLGYKRLILPSAENENIKEKLYGLGIDKSKLIFWFSGTFGKTYDLIPIIKAANKLQTKDVQFVFSGKGEQEKIWMNKSKGLKNIIFTGWLNASELHCMSQIADIGLMAYAKGAPQGLPNKLFEYLSAGLPIISSLKGESENLLLKNKCGLIYDASSENNLFDCLTYLLNNLGELETMKSNAIRLFDKSFDSDNINSEIMEYLKSLLNKYR